MSHLFRLQGQALLSHCLVVFKTNKIGKFRFESDAAVSAWTWPFHFKADACRTIGSALWEGRFCMITLFIIGILVLVVKMIHFAFKAAWGITRGILFTVGIPALLMVLFVAGLVSFAVPLLLLALLAAFIWPVLKGR